MDRRRIFWAWVFGIFIFGAVCFGATITVNWDGSSDYTTIQSAIDAADDGDTVVVADGTYTGSGNCDVDFLGKAITVRSENGTTSCIIDCGGSYAEPHRGFKFISGEGSKSILDGFTITNGYAPEEDLDGDGYYLCTGGGIICYESSPTLINCIVSSSWAEYGGGFWCRMSNLKITDCIFEGNSAVVSGGGIYYENESSVELKSCIFDNNIAGGCGGGVYSGVLNADGCEIINNESYYEGGGLWAERGIITNTIIKGNTAWYLGGGISGINVKLDNCLVVGNVSESYGSGVRISSLGEMSYHNINNCTITGNMALARGGGIEIGPDSIGKITNSIIWGNGGYVGQELSVLGAKVKIENCNIGMNEQDVYVRDSSLILGEGNIDAEPGFVNAYYANPNSEPWDEYYGLLVVEDAGLQSDSPCIDAGMSELLIPLERFDIIGQLRVLDGDGNGEQEVDIGAYEYFPGGAVIATDRDKLEFMCYENGNRMKEDSIQIFNTGDGLVEWQITEDCEWLEVLPTNGTADAEGVEVTFDVDATGLELGVYASEVTISDDDAINNPVTIKVVLYVIEDMGLWVPFHYETIQAAVDAACDFETVTVADGIYTGDRNRDIYVNKTIVIKSATGAANCVVDCQHEEDVKGFYFDGVDPNCVLDGFTIIGGNSYIGGGIFCRYGDVTIENCVIADNFSEFGGGIGFSSGGGIVKSCRIIENIAVGDGGGIRCIGGEEDVVTIIDSTISDNISADIFAWGGGVYCEGTDLDVSNCKIENNKCGARGGGICGYDEVEVVISDSVIADNEVSLNEEYASYGGGVYCGPRGSLNIEDSVIENNNGGHGGGVYCMIDCAVKVVGSEICGNSASSEDGMGGGIRCDGRNYDTPCTLEIYDCLVEGNTAFIDGGICFLGGDYFEMEGCVLENNTATFGAGGADFDDIDQIDIRESIVRRNAVSEVVNLGGIAGGMVFNDSNVFLKSCEFVGNIGSVVGGISSHNYNFSDNLCFQNCIFKNNTGSIGGIRCSSYCNSLFQNCVLSGNSGGEIGGLYYGGAYGNVVNCTIVGNEAFGPQPEAAGMYLDAYGWGSYAFVDFANCIVRDNRCEGDIEVKVLKDYIGSPGIYSNVKGGWEGEENIDADPEFVEAGYWDPNDTPEDETDDFWVEGDYHLRWTSPCINMGDPNFISEEEDVDIDGEPRVMGGRVDMGADEVGPKQADFTRDGVINIDDFGVLGNSWGSSEGGERWYVLCDLWEDGIIDITDLAAFVEDWLWAFN